MGAKQSISSKDYIVATDDNTTVLLRRHEVAYYDSLLSILCKHFPSISKESMVIQTNELDICAGRYVDIPQELWSDVGLWILNIRVISRTTGTSAPLGQKMTINVRTKAGKTIQVVLPEDSLISELAALLQDHEGRPIGQPRLIYAGKQLEFGRMLSDYNISDESTVACEDGLDEWEVRDEEG